MKGKAGRLEGKVALIVGGGAGIGAAAARMFAREGARVAVADLLEDKAGEVARAIVEAGGTAQAWKVDVTSDDSVKAVVDAAVARFGRLDVLLDTAGGSLPQDGHVTDVDLSVWDRTAAVDARGAILCCRHAIPHLIAGGGGSVVLMSSAAALRGAGRQHIYAAVKGAIVSLARTLAGTYAKHGIRVNAICSGRINTERVRSTYGIPGVKGHSPDTMGVDERVKIYPFWYGEPEDMANVALFLASDESRMITGASIPADGGHSAY